MSTLEFVSASADGIADIGVPLVTAPTLVEGLGSHPAVTVPLVGGRPPAAATIWAVLSATAECYGSTIPDADALEDALTAFLAEAVRATGDHAVTVAADVVAVPTGGRTQFVVSGRVIEPVRARSVTLSVRPYRPIPTWRVAAEHTTSRAADDLLAGTLAADGHADIVDVDGARVGRPQFGALVFENSGNRIGTGAQRLTLLQAGGLLDPFPVADEPVPVAETAEVWWVSARFERHPVAAIGTRRFGATR